MFGPKLARSSLVALLAIAPLRGQMPSLSFDDLARAPGVDPAQVQWLRSHLTAAERDTVVHLVEALSRPEAVQLLPAFFYLDGTAESPFGTPRVFLDSVVQRPPTGGAGVVRAVYLAARMRDTVLRDARRAGFYAIDWLGRPYAPAHATMPPTSDGTTIDLAFDFVPADTLLAILGTPNVTAREAERRISTPVFDALIEHRSQSFYPVPLSREQLALVLAHAASPDPLDQLYMWAQPRGFYDYANVGRHRAAYRALVDTLRAHQADIVGRVAVAIAPYLPSHTRLVRHLSFYFADGANGWATSHVAAIDLEWFKDDYERLVNLTTHETFHAAQTAARGAQAPEEPSPNPVLAQAMDVIFLEGTATFIAPPSPRTAEQRAAAIHEGARLLDAIAHETNATVAQTALDRGTASAGPFYWLGAAMSQVIVDALGPRALATTLRTGANGFFATYRAALTKRPATADVLALIP